MQTLKILQERAIQKFEKDHRLEDGRLADIGFNGGTTEDFMNSLITEVWNEAIREERKSVYRQVEDYVMTDQPLKVADVMNKLMHVCKGEDLSEPDITSDKTDV